MNQKDAVDDTKPGPEAQLFESYKSRVGEELGVSDWFVVTQRDADMFAALTNDWDYMHNDPAWATERYGGTIVHGLYILTFIPVAQKELESGAPIVSTDTATVFNYGYNKVRMIRPLLVGERFRDRMSVVSVVEKKLRHYLVEYGHTFETESRIGEPFCVAEKLSYYFTQ